MAWIMNSKKVDNEVHFFIGQVKIAEIVMDKRATKWHYYLRLMANYVAYDIPKDGRYETFSAALKDLHKRLQSPPPADHNVGRIWE